MIEYLSWSKEKTLENLDKDPEKAVITLLKDIQNHSELSDLIDTAKLGNLLLSHLLFENYQRIREIIKSLEL